MATPVGCFYCGKVTPWYACDCRYVQEIRAGKRVSPKVKIVAGRTVIVVDAETAERNILGFERYTAGQHNSSGGVTAGVVVTLASTEQELPAASRAAYMRDYRARQKQKEDSDE